MSATLLQEIRSLERDFLAAVRTGEHQLAVFTDRLATLQQLLSAGSAAGMVSPDVWAAAQDAFANVAELATSLHDYDVQTDTLVENDTDDSSANPSASLPLFQYMLDNICYPYPDPEEKERLVHEAREAGWRDFDKKKCEDWLNRKRHQAGYVAIARKYCDEDLDAMRALCYAALYGSPEQKAHVHPSALDEIIDMFEQLQSQHDDLIEGEDSPWMDDLTSKLNAVLGEPGSEHLTAELLSSDNEMDAADYSDFTDDEADSDSDASATDVDSDDEDAVKEDEIDLSPAPGIGAKRKSSDLPPLTPPRGRLLARTPSTISSSSSSSDSVSSGASLRSFSGSSVSSMTSWEEDESERPAKRTRNESFSPEPASPTSDSRTTPDMWVMRVSSNAVALSKRKRDDDDLETLARNMKRSRYAALSAAAPSNIPAHHLNSLTDVCTRSWNSVVPFDVLGYSVDSELYTVDCTAMQTVDDDEDSDEDEDEDNNLADIIGLCNDPDAPDDATWATVQLHALAQTLTGSRLPMAAELCADTVEVKLEELSPQELSSLGETLATTAESITADYPLDQSLLLEDDDAFSPPELSDGESSGSSSPDRSPSPPVELESSPERLMADYAMSTRTRKELDTLQHPWFAQMFGQQGLSFFDPNTFRVECNPPPGMMAQESQHDFLAQLDL